MVEDLVIDNDLKNLVNFNGLFELIKVKIWIIIFFDDLKNKIVFFEDSKGVFEIFLENVNEILLCLDLRKRRVDNLARTNSTFWIRRLDLGSENLET